MDRIYRILTNKHLALALIFGLWSVISTAQLNFDFQEGKFLIKGKVLDLQTKKPIPSTNIRINGTNKGVTCDNNGVFSFYVYKRDTLKFTSTGYISKALHVYDLDSTKYYVLEIELLRDFVKLKEVRIYPYHDMDEFKKAFVEAKELKRPSNYGVPLPKYSNEIPRAKLTNPISFLYERLHHRRVANPDFKP